MTLDSGHFKDRTLCLQKKEDFFKSPKLAAKNQTINMKIN